MKKRRRVGVEDANAIVLWTIQEREGKVEVKVYTGLYYTLHEPPYQACLVAKTAVLKC